MNVVLPAPVPPAPGPVATELIHDPEIRLHSVEALLKERQRAFIELVTTTETLRMKVAHLEERYKIVESHLKDEGDFYADVAANKLPAVSFIKPLGADNEHPGYATEMNGQQHAADLVSAIQNSPYWADTAIIITYDEHGGRWDHVAPPVVDKWGPGIRVPSIVISPATGRCRPAIALTSVLLPAPFGPTIQTSSPARMSRETSNSAGAAP